MRVEMEETNALLTSDNNRSEVYRGVRSRLNQAYYVDGRCGYLRAPIMDVFQLDNAIRTKLRLMDTAELTALRTTVSKEASRFWWQKIIHYGISGVSAAYTAAILILSVYYTSTPLFATSVSLGFPSGAGFLRLGASTKQRQNLADKAVEIIDEILTLRAAIPGSID